MDTFDILNKEYGEGEFKYIVTKYCGLNPSQYHVYEIKFLETGNTYERVRSSVMKGKLVDTKKKVSITKQANLLKRKEINKINVSADDSYKTISGTFNGKERYLVLDQATVNTGYCVVEGNNVLDMGFIRQSRGQSTTRRINSTKKEVRTLIDSYDIKHVVLEDIFLSNNLKVYRALSALIGVITDMCLESDVSVSLVIASVWRKQYGISGNRANCKIKALNMARTKFGIELTKDEEDLAEALLITHYMMEESGEAKDMYDWK